MTASILKSPWLFSAFLTDVNNYVVLTVSTRPPILTLPVRYQISSDRSESRITFCIAVTFRILWYGEVLVSLFVIFDYYLLYLLFTHYSFSHQRLLMVFYWSLSDNKSPQISRILLSILAVLNSAVVWMLSTRQTTSKSSSPLSNLLDTVPNAPITIGIIVTYMFHSFFNSLVGPGTYSSFHILSVLFCGQLGQQSRQFCIFSFFCWLLLSLVFWPRFGDSRICQSSIEFMWVIF